MKTKLCLGIFLLAAAMSRAQTNNLTTLLQQGLFEEQANRNLDAAIENYTALARQFDKDRQLAATAVFRLGECYRAQGKTNEAAAQYQRILRDFPDQKTLVTLSLQNLKGMGMEPKAVGAVAAESGMVATGAALELEKELALLKTQIELAQRETNRFLLIESVGDKKWLDDFNTCERVRSRLENAKAGGKSEWTVADLEGSLATMEDKLKTDFDHWLAGQDFRRRYLESAIVQTRGLSVANPIKNSTATVVTDEEEREIARIEKLIQTSPDLINTEDSRSATRTPLITAASVGWLKVAAYLLDHGADVNRSATDVSLNAELQQAGRVSPLLTAVAAGNKAMTKFLIERGADVNSRDSQGKTPLNTAVEKKFQAVVEVLLANKADVNVENKIGVTPLASAAINKQEKTIQSLLAAGANPNLENKDGRTPFSFAAESGAPEIVKMFLAAKADPNGGRMNAPLLSAIHASDVVSAELLLQAGAKPNAENKVHWQDYSWGYHYEGAFGVGLATPLWLAVHMNQFPVAQLLLKYKADPDDLRPDSRPLLFSALADTNMLEALLAAGAKVDARDTTINTSIENQPINWTPLHLAGNSSPEAVAILLWHGANPNAQDYYGSTPLHHATDISDPTTSRKVFELLLANNANPNVRNNSGQTPLDMLKNNSQQNTPRTLRAGRPLGGLTGAGLVLANSGENSSPDKAKPAGDLADLLRQHGALVNLPNWDRITVSRPAASFSQKVFQKGTNDWNQFTLLELICAFDENNSRPNSPLAFADLTHLVVVRPSATGVAAQRIEVNLLSATNGVDLAKDMPLEFGDVVEIPEREHTLAEPVIYLKNDLFMMIYNFLRSKAGSAKLMVKGGEAVSLPLQALHSQIGSALLTRTAQSVLSSASELAQVKVSRRDLKTGKTMKWILDCSHISTTTANGYSTYPNCGAPDLVLRDGDVLEVPQKP